MTIPPPPGNDFDMAEPLLVMYALRNQDGQYMRTKGYGGTGESWVDGLERAKIWGKLSTIRSQQTFWANNYPDYGIPDIIELRVTLARVLYDEKYRAQKAVDKLATKAEEELVRSRKRQLDRAQDDLTRAQGNLEKARAAR